jgi:hypothetical protein
MNDLQDDVGRLIQAAGRRSAPSRDSLARMREAVHAEWQAGLRRRSRNRLFAIAASVLVLVGGGLLVANGPGLRPDGGAVVASLVQPGTAVSVDSGWRGWLRSSDSPDDLHAGDIVSTGSQYGTTLVRLPDARTTLRLDAATRLAWSSPGRVRLLSGRVYIDTGSGADGAPAADPLRIEAADTLVEHVGTRFVTSVDGSVVEVAVRDGLVRVTTAAQVASLARGERARVEGQGAIVKAAGSAAGDGWGWVDALAPRLAIEGRDLLTVLRSLGFEAGVELAFAGQDIEARAGATVLHGPPVDLPPLEAMQAILATTSFVTREDGRPDRLRLELR